MWIAQGMLGEAWAGRASDGLAATDDLTYLREFEHITLAELLVAQGTRDRADDAIGEAQALTERLLAAADAGDATAA